jgi:hypothetical protein
MDQGRKLGPMGKVMGLVPGMKDMLEQVRMQESNIEHEFLRMRAIRNSMTPSERADPDQIDGPRRHRIARGAGVPVADVCKFLLDFDQSRAVMAAVGRTGVLHKVNPLRDHTSPKLTLGLVTPHRHHRDPSHVHRDPPARRAATLAFVIALSITTAAAVLLALLHRLLP